MLYTLLRIGYLAAVAAYITHTHAFDLQSVFFQKNCNVAVVLNRCIVVMPFDGCLWVRVDLAVECALGTVLYLCV